MEFDEMKRNTSNWSNFCMFLRRAGLTASAGLSCFTFHFVPLCVVLDLYLATVSLIHGLLYIVNY